MEKEGQNLDPSITNASTKSKKKKKKRETTFPVERTGELPQNHCSPSEVSTTTDTKSPFQVELDWCIAQLELGMLRQGATRPQKQQNERNIRTLQASKTPVPKKRQLMRSLFGDYRSKMKQQPVPESLVARETKLEPAKAEVIETVGTYYRHAKSHDHVDSDFKFNFNISSS